MTDEHSEEYYRRLVDEEALEQLLIEHLGETGVYEVLLHPEGHSNETLFVTWGDEELVIRRPPPGETASGAHDVLREYRVQDALQDSAVPVPPTVFADEDDVLDSEFYVMKRLDGDVIRLSEPDRFATPGRRQDVGEELIDTLTAIHSVDYEAVGLGDFGRPEGFTQRQVDIWTQQFEWAYEVTAKEREIPNVDTVTEFLQANVPSDPPATLVHGDFKLDNVMYAPGLPPKIVAVFDWELSSLGDPLTDLGWWFAFWRDEGDPEPLAPELIPGFVDRPGYPSRRDIVERYERKSGIEFTNRTFYRTLGMFKLTGVCEMFYRRHLEGNSDDPLYPLMEEYVPNIVDRTVDIIEGRHPL